MYQCGREPHENRRTKIMAGIKTQLRNVKTMSIDSMELTVKCPDCGELMHVTINYVGNNMRHSINDCPKCGANLVVCEPELIQRLSNPPHLMY
jgi:ribosomal protein S27E